MVLLYFHSVTQENVKAPREDTGGEITAFFWFGAFGLTWELCNLKNDYYTVIEYLEMQTAYFLLTAITYLRFK